MTLVYTIELRVLVKWVVMKYHAYFFATNDHTATFVYFYIPLRWNNQINCCSIVYYKTLLRKHPKLAHKTDKFLEIITASSRHSQIPFRKSMQEGKENLNFIIKTKFYVLYYIIICLVALSYWIWEDFM